MRTEADSDLLTSSAIQAWSGAPSSNALPALNIADDLAWARRRWRADSHRWVDLAELLPDRLHALVRIVREDRDASVSSVAAWYHLIERVDWGADLFAEQIDVLCQLGYLAWRQAFRLGTAAEAWVWEERVSGLASRLPSVSEFMHLSESKRTDQVLRRYLSDPVVLLAECHRILDYTNRNPLEALQQATAAYRFLSGSRLWTWSLDEHAYFQSMFALAIGVAEKGVGHYDSSTKWLDNAEKLCPPASGSEAVKARITFARKALAYQLGQWEEALAGTAELRDRFANLRSAKYVARCTFVEGVALKELGRDAEAVLRLLEVASTADAGVEGWFRGWAMIPVAEIYAHNGNDIAADETLTGAWELIRDSGVVAAIAHCHASKGEILRDRGSFDASIQSYRLAVVTYASGGLRALEAYLRVLLAETLLVAGEDREALLEIMKVLPVIEALGLVREAVVAVGLLRESLARQEPNPEALTIIKNELQKLQKRGQS